MKVLTTNFLTCAVKSCKPAPTSYPLHFKDAELTRTEQAYNPLFLRNILPRVDMPALRTTAGELGLAAAVPEDEDVARIEEKRLWLNKQKQVPGGKLKEKEMEEEKGNVDVGDDAMVTEEVEAGQPQEGAEKQSSTISEAEENVILRRLHGLLLETAVMEGKLVCGNCGFEYPIKEGVGNFLLPSHLV